MSPDQAGDKRPGEPSVIHATNAWNPTGQNLQRVPGSRLYFAHVTALGGPRTQVFLGSQRHLTFVADLADHLPPGAVRDSAMVAASLYPHLVEDASDNPGAEPWAW